MKQYAPRLGGVLPIAAMVVLVLWSWLRLEFFEMSRTVPAAEGVVRWPNALASVDHPFHAARFGMFLDALRNGHVPHWVFSHQGGYPAEFYPFGSSLVDLLVWVVTLGQMSIPMVHTWSVGIVFALPALGFLGIARLSGMSLWIAPVALACHLCIRGWWWSGSSYELIEWGLVTNVLAAVLIFLAMVAIASAMTTGNLRWLALAAGLIAWAEITNPRSLIAVATVALAAAAVWMLETGERRLSLPWLVAPFVLGLAGAAPLLVSLIRYNDLYFFVHYSGYAGLREWLDSSIQAVSGPVFVVAVVGLLIALLTPVSIIEKVVTWTTVIYCALTAYLVLIDWPARWTEQLETTRLMPFQRLLMIAFAAIAVGRLSQLISTRWSEVTCAGLAALIPIIYVMAPPGFIPESDRGLVRDGTMAQAGIVDLRTAVELADRTAPADTAILILGTTAFWHDSLWAPLWSDRLFFYDDWLWYWQREHVGAYDPSLEHAYPVDSSTVDPEYLATHGIGAVVVTGEARGSAEAAPFLEQTRAGTYDVYLVLNPTSLATIGIANAPSSIDDEAISVSGIQAGGAVVVRENWFPRWRAAVDGEAVAVVHRPDGYMEVTVPPGSESVVFHYERTTLDWIALIVAFAAGMFSLVILILVRPTARLEPR
jgi:hypothetical protein